MKRRAAVASNGGAYIRSTRLPSIGRDPTELVIQADFADPHRVAVGEIAEERHNSGGRDWNNELPIFAAGKVRIHGLGPQRQAIRQCHIGAKACSPAITPLVDFGKCALNRRFAHGYGRALSIFNGLCHSEATEFRAGLWKTAESTAKCQLSAPSPYPEICAEAMRASCIRMKSAPNAPALRM